MLVLGDGGLRCEELAGLQRADFVAARKGAKLRALEVRHGKGDRGRTVKLSERASRAIVRWERERAAVLGAPARDAALFITLGRRRADGTYAGVGRRCGQPTLAAVIKRLGSAAKIPPELRHPHALRHSCATELLRTGANIADVRTILGHASIKTTPIYLASDQQRQEDVVARRERGGLGPRRGPRPNGLSGGGGGPYSARLAFRSARAIEAIELLGQQPHRLQPLDRQGALDQTNQRLASDSPQRSVTLGTQYSHIARLFGIVGHQHQRRGTTTLPALPRRSQLGLFHCRGARVLDSVEQPAGHDAVAIGAGVARAAQCRQAVKDLGGVHDAESEAENTPRG